MNLMMKECNLTIGQSLWLCSKWLMMIAGNVFEILHGCESWWLRKMMIVYEFKMKHSRMWEF